MAYQALYRVWRSQRFEDIVGQKAVTQTLKKCYCFPQNLTCLLVYRTQRNRKDECSKDFRKSNQLSEQ